MKREFENWLLEIKNITAEMRILYMGYKIRKQR